MSLFTDSKAPTCLETHAEGQTHVDRAKAAETSSHEGNLEVSVTVTGGVVTCNLSVTHDDGQPGPNRI